MHRFWKSRKSGSLDDATGLRDAKISIDPKDMAEFCQTGLGDAAYRCRAFQSAERALTATMVSNTCISDCPCIAKNIPEHDRSRRNNG